MADALPARAFYDVTFLVLQATGARPSQVHRLLSDLTRRGPLAFDKFLLCLDETDQSHVADKLREAADAAAAHEPSCDRFSSRKASYVRPVRASLVVLCRLHGCCCCSGWDCFRTVRSISCHPLNANPCRSSPPIRLALRSPSRQNPGFKISAGYRYFLTSFLKKRSTCSIYCRALNAEPC